jgi:hypothetical protein
VSQLTPFIESCHLILDLFIIAGQQLGLVNRRSLPVGTLSSMGFKVSAIGS